MNNISLTLFTFLFSLLSCQHCYAAELKVSVLIPPSSNLNIDSLNQQTKNTSFEKPNFLYSFYRQEDSQKGIRDQAKQMIKNNINIVIGYDSEENLDIAMHQFHDSNVIVISPMAISEKQVCYENFLSLSTSRERLQRHFVDFLQNHTSNNRFGLLAKNSHDKNKIYRMLHKDIQHLSGYIQEEGLEDKHIQSFKNQNIAAILITSSLNQSLKLLSYLSMNFYEIPSIFINDYPQFLNISDIRQFSNRPVFFLQTGLPIKSTSSLPYPFLKDAFNLVTSALQKTPSRSMQDIYSSMISTENYQFNSCGIPKSLKPHVYTIVDNTIIDVL